MLLLVLELSKTVSLKNEHVFFENFLVALYICSADVCKLRISYCWPRNIVEPLGMCLVGNTGVGGAARYWYDSGHHSQFSHEGDNADCADECCSDAPAHRSVAADTPPHCHREYPLLYVHTVLLSTIILEFYSIFILLLDENVIGNTRPYHYYNVVNFVQFLLANTKKHVKGMLNMVIIHIIYHYFKKSTFLFRPYWVRSVMFLLKVKSRTVWNNCVILSML